MPVAPFWLIWRMPVLADRRWRHERFDRRAETLFSAFGGLFSLKTFNCPAKAAVKAEDSVHGGKGFGRGLQVIDACH